MSTFVPFVSDDEIVAIGRGLATRTLPKSDWTHVAHFAAALWLLAYDPEIDDSQMMPNMIRAYNQATGVANTDSSGYHETIIRRPSGPLAPSWRRERTNHYPRPVTI